MRQQFPKPLRRYAGILIDLSFDHFLTRHWTRYSDLPLSSFNQQVYTILDTHSHLLSTRAGVMAQRLQEFNILDRYHDWNTVTETASRVGQRFKRGNPLSDTKPLLQPLIPELETAFLNFYPQLINFCQERPL